MSCAKQVLSPSLSLAFSANVITQLVLPLSDSRQIRQVLLNHPIARRVSQLVRLVRTTTRCQLKAASSAIRRLRDPHRNHRSPCQSRRFGVRRHPLRRVGRAGHVRWRTRWRLYNVTHAVQRVRDLTMRGGRVSSAVKGAMNTSFGHVDLVVGSSSSLRQYMQLQHT